MRLLSLFDGIIHLAFVTRIYWARIVFGGSCTYIPSIERVDTDIPGRPRELATRHMMDVTAPNGVFGIGKLLIGSVAVHEMCG
jgi:hypothetical protein